ncbi:mannose-6-phosphate isomerase, class I [Alteribacillus sp. HJP-4]|uniref:mannose-6-phosphate isomerase, class I n=1 Tax=Alteribacillus sp. HJP-4 TaxID=2775394 RepID=UPI0035CCDE5D
MEPLFLEPIFKEKIWGGERLRQYGYDIPTNKTGEAWCISAHPNGSSKISSGTYEGWTLRELWNTEPALFGEKTVREFPLLVKLLDANDILSVQVHPNDEQAQKLEPNEAYGKTECWYIAHAEPGAELILGHHASSREEFKDKVKKEKWETLFKRVPVKSGDFYFVPSGTIHAIGKGIVILEIQQSSDTTYRVYDFDRTDNEGHKRELHLKKAVEVTTVPARDATPNKKILSESSGTILTELLSDNYFSVYKCDLGGSFALPLKTGLNLFSVLTGSGQFILNDKKYLFEKGDHFILPAGSKDKELELRGKASLMIANEGSH